MIEIEVMVKVLVFSFFVLLFAPVSFGQEKVKISTGGSNTYIETYSKNSFRGYDSGEYKLDEAYRLGPTSAKTLKSGIKKALEWADLNKEHQKEFDKEVCRFKVMDKETYKFHGYVDEFTKEMVLTFHGNSSGGCSASLKIYDSYGTFLSLDSKEDMNDILDMLNGKSVNDEIDDIFK